MRERERQDRSGRRLWRGQRDPDFADDSCIAATIAASTSGQKTNKGASTSLRDWPRTLAPGTRPK